MNEITVSPKIFIKFRLKFSYKNKKKGNTGKFIELQKVKICYLSYEKLQKLSLVLRKKYFFVQYRMMILM